VFFILAALGGEIVFLGLWVEKEAEEESEKDNSDFFRPHKSTEKIGWIILMIGIGAEVFIATALAIHDDWEIRIASNNAAKNNPLVQPVSNISAIFRLIVTAKSYQPRNLISLDDISLNFGKFQMIAKQCRWYEHLDSLTEPRHVAFYTIAIYFEQSHLPYGDWNDINTPMPDYFMPPSMTVSNALNDTHGFFSYIGFIPKNAEVIKGTIQFSINGFNKTFQLNSNSVAQKYYEWNTNMTGLCLEVTNSP
jgi:hypothetical protein